MNRTRRGFLRNATLFGTSLFAASEVARAERQDTGQGGHEGMQMPMPEAQHQSRERPGAQAFVPVVTPDGADLPFAMDGSVKVFHLVAEPVKQEIVPGKIVNLWGYNGRAPGPTIQAMQGDRVRMIVDNRLPEPTAVHWHGLEIPFDMDGSPGLSQDPIGPGGRAVYEFTLHQEGTYFYHPHLAMQEMMGMIGAFIIHPSEPYDPPVDKDFLIALQEYALLPNNFTPNSMSMEYNWLTFNGKSGPATTPLIVRVGDRVKIRLINIGMDHHPIHLHGHQFVVTGTEGGRQPKSTWGPGNTVLVAVAQARDVEFVAKYPGDWMLHCHLPHHMMNQMSSMVGPMTRRPGMPAGAGMEEGMGIPRAGSATSEENGPSLGRGMGVGSTLESATSNGPLSSSQNAPEADIGQDAGGMGMEMEPEKADVAKNANSVPGFPQDAFMEGPPMAMDSMYDKPETFGLRPGWSGFVQGMMTLVRVMPPDKYDQIMDLRKKQAKTGTASPDAMPGMNLEQ
ncbi:MAG TPA: copper oxidase [Candidatus Acidoferrales bacterium]|jgi:FtsP/CotA-like multicopper oxidase with cupredoxin domain|nr:copper oxidase [Candidatus Acidoferrales bacterium]